MVTSPHDALIRRVFGTPYHAASELKAVLPAPLVARLDWSQMQLVSANFVGSELRERRSDLLFSLPFDRRDGQDDAFIYVLIEHQSSSDPLMPYRVFEYMMQVWDRHLRRNHRAQVLPLVCPMVLHHNTASNTHCWSSPVEFSNLFSLDPELDAALGHYVPRFRFLLDDLVTVDHDALRRRPLTPPARATLLLLKTASGNHDLDVALEAWLDDLNATRNGPDGDDLFQTLVNYISLVAETPPDRLRHLFAQLGPDAEETYVTTADMLIDQGRAEGRTEGQAGALVRQVTQKFGPQPQDVLDAITNATTEQLDTWLTRILTANTINELLH